MKVFLTLGVKKSILKELAFVKSDFLLDLAKFSNFAIVDKFLLLSPTPLAASALIALLDTS